MAVTRQDALNYVKAIMDPIYTAAGKLLTDTTTGYGPAIDETFRSLGATDLVGPVLPDSLRPAAWALLRYYSVEFVLPALALIVDQQVDAPLTNIKASQMFKHAVAIRDSAKADAMAYGYGPTGVVYTTLALNHLEPVAE